MSNVNFDFRGKNFAVTGASSGIGKQVVFELLGAGANVLALARRKELMDELYSDYPDQIVTAQLDVRDQSGLDDVLKSFVTSKGKFHGSVYAAGIGGSSPLRMLELDNARNMMKVNFFGAVEFLRRMTAATIANRGSSNVWIASISAHSGTQGVSMYGATKGAMLSSIRALALEISKKKHRLNSVSPGWVKTSLTEKFSEQTGIEEKDSYANDRYVLGADGRPEDVSGTILFLLSDRTRWITGTDIVIDGGYLAG